MVEKWLLVSRAINYEKCGQYVSCLHTKRVIEKKTGSGVVWYSIADIIVMIQEMQSSATHLNWEM